jgi:hypothetical protein
LKPLFLNISSTGELSIRFASDSVIPTNESSITDDSVETCSDFQTRDNDTLLHNTHLRIVQGAGQVGDINVTITGGRLECRSNLYVTPLAIHQSHSWLGRWIRCTLLETSMDENRERCTYFCTSPGYWREIQVLKVDEYSWEICHINITAKLPGE